MNRLLRLSRLLLGCACVLMASQLAAVGSNEPPPNSTDVAKSEFVAGRAAITRKDWKEAVSIFSGVVAREPHNADAWNWLGYSLRQAGRLDEAFKAYGTALKIDPAHLGAHEYVGEAWLMAGKPEKALEHLDAIAALCKTRCEEYDTLKKSITSWNTKRTLRGNVY